MPRRTGGYDRRPLSPAWSCASWAAFSGFWFAAAISRPISRLRDGVRQVGEGDFSVAVPVRGVREAADLAVSFNDLGQQLTEYIEKRDFIRDTFGRYVTQEVVTKAAGIRRGFGNGRRDPGGLPHHVGFAGLYGHHRRDGPGAGYHLSQPLFEQDDRYSLWITGPSSTKFWGMAFWPFSAPPNPWKTTRPGP